MTSERILFVRNCRGITDVTGAETYLMTLMEGLSRAGVTVNLLCAIDAGKGETAWLKALRARGLPHRLVDVPKTVSRADLTALRDEIARFRPDCLHAMDHRSDAMAVIAARMTGVPAVASFFGWTNWEATSMRARIYPLIDKLVMRGLKKVIVDSGYIGGQTHSGTTNPRIAVIPNGVDLNRFDPDTVRPTLKSRWFGDAPVTLVGMIGRIHPNKGQIDMARAAARVMARDPALRVVVIGDTTPGYEDYHRDLKAELQTLGIEDKFLVTNIPSADIPDAIASFDITAIPSYMESLSYVMLESMAMRKPVISARVGGHGDLIRDGENGFLIASGDVDALADTVARLAADPTLCARVGSAGRASVEAQYSTDVMVERTRAVYAEARA